MEAISSALLTPQCVVLKPLVQEKKVVFPAITKTGQGPPRRVVDLVSVPGDIHTIYIISDEAQSLPHHQ